MRTRTLTLYDGSLVRRVGQFRNAAAVGRWLRRAGHVVLKTTVGKGVATFQLKGGLRAVLAKVPEFDLDWTTPLETHAENFESQFSETASQYPLEWIREIMERGFEDVSWNDTDHCYPTFENEQFQIIVHKAAPHRPSGVLQFRGYSKRGDEWRLVAYTNSFDALFEAFANHGAAFYREYGAHVDDFDLQAVKELRRRGWKDTSWHNDAYPSFEFGPYDEDGNGAWRLWLLDTDPSKREPGDEKRKRFSLCFWRPLGDGREVFESDDLTEVLKVIPAHSALFEPSERALTVLENLDDAGDHSELITSLRASLDAYAAHNTPRLPSAVVDSPMAAQEWIEELHRAGLLFHLEDPPHEIVESSSGKQTFNDVEQRKLRHDLRLVWEHHADPMRACNELVNPENFPYSASPHYDEHENVSGWGVVCQQGQLSDWVCEGMTKDEAHTMARWANDNLGNIFPSVANKGDGLHNMEAFDAELARRRKGDGDPIKPALFAAMDSLASQFGPRFSAILAEYLQRDN